VETQLRRIVLTWPFAASIGTLVLAIWGDARTSLPVQVSGAQKDIYIASAGIGATLLGFTMAALAFLVALPEDRPLLQRIRREGQHAKILRRFAMSTLYLALVVFVGVGGVFIDRQPTNQVDAHALGTGSYWVWVLIAVLVPSMAWLGRSLRALIDVVPLAGAGRRKDY
jgi:hypothetical protein